MKTTLILLGTLTFAYAASLSVKALDTLWDLNFKNLKPGEALTEVAYTPPCSGPQRVVTDAANTLVGATAVGPLATSLLFDKTSKTNYTPSFTLKSTGEGFNSGVITVTFDLTFDHMTINADRPVEALMAIPFLNGQGGSEFILVIAGKGTDELVFGAAGLAKGKQPLEFKVREVAHIKAVLDLNKHTFQAFLNDAPYADAEHDDKKFTSFLGLTIRDGTAVGGNNGGTFAAGIANLVVTRQ